VRWLCFLVAFPRGVLLDWSFEERPMKMRSMVATAMLATVAVVVGCSSSSSDGGNASAPTCKGATGSTGAGSSACNSCTQSSCGSQISALEGACSAFVNCYEGCDCSNQLHRGLSVPDRQHLHERLQPLHELPRPELRVTVHGIDGARRRLASSPRGIVASQESFLAMRRPLRAAPALRSEMPS